MSLTIKGNLVTQGPLWAAECEGTVISLGTIIVNFYKRNMGADSPHAIQFLSWLLSSSVLPFSRSVRSNWNCEQFIVFLSGNFSWNVHIYIYICSYDEHMPVTLSPLCVPSTCPAQLELFLSPISQSCQICSLVLFFNMPVESSSPFHHISFPKQNPPGMPKYCIG